MLCVCVMPVIQGWGRCREGGGARMTALGLEQGLILVWSEVHELPRSQHVVARRMWTGGKERLITGCLWKV